jgi:hypothetical protein
MALRLRQTQPADFSLHLNSRQHAVYEGAGGTVNISDSMLLEVILKRFVRQIPLSHVVFD